MIASVKWVARDAAENMLGGAEVPITQLRASLFDLEGQILEELRKLDPAVIRRARIVDGDIVGPVTEISP